MPPELPAATPPVAPLPPKGWRAVLRIAAGVGLCLVGIVGLILPVMPGWIFLIPGLMILGDYFPPIKRLLEWAKEKFEDARGASGGRTVKTEGKEP